MKIPARQNILIVILVAVAQALAPISLRASNTDVEIHIEPRELDQKAKTGHETLAVTKEHWVYAVTVENKTFKPLQNIQIAYVAFFTREIPGAKGPAAANRKKGGLTVPLLQSHEKKEFLTEMIELNKTHLVGNVVWASGAKANSSDVLVGLWVRLMQGGQQFAEYANPSTLLREKWE